MLYSNFRVNNIGIHSKRREEFQEPPAAILEYDFWIYHSAFVTIQVQLTQFQISFGHEATLVIAEER